MEYPISLTISPDIHKEYPGVVICLAQADLSLMPDSHRFSEIPLPSHTEIKMDEAHINFWHEIYKKFGVNPKRNKPSFEALTTRYIKQNFIPSINPIVDLYNRISIKYQIPAGAFASSTISPEIKLRQAEPGETFRAIGSNEAEEIPAGTVIYSIPHAVITYGWNYRDADPTKVTDDTQHITFAFESSLEHKPHLEHAIQEINSLLPLNHLSYYTT